MIDLTDPTHVGLILVATGVFGIGGGNIKWHNLLEVSLNSTKGRFVFVVLLVVLVGLGMIVHDYFTNL